MTDGNSKSAVVPKRLVHVMTVPMSLRFLSGQLRYMRERGLEVHVVCSPGPGFAEFMRREGVTGHSLAMSRRITPLADFGALVRLYRVLRTLRPAIVHAHTPKGGLLGMLAARGARVPARVYHMRGLPHVTATGWRRRILRFTERVSCRLADQVVCVGPSLAATAQAEGVCADRPLVLAKGSGNGVDARGKFDPARGARARAAMRRELGIPAEAWVVGFVGRVVPDKGVEDLIEAWRELRAEREDAWLLVVGAPEAESPLSPEAARILRDDRRIARAGMVDAPESLYPAMDVVVLPTHREGFPNVPLEAAAMGLPVVATRVPGCVDAVVEDRTGSLVSPADPPALARALRRYGEDPKLARRHGEAGRERVLRDFVPERIWSELYDLYVELVPSARGISDAAGSDPPPSRTIVERRLER